MPEEKTQPEPMSLADINDLRAQVAAGEQVSDERLAAAVTACRKGRFSAESSAKTKAQPVSIFDLRPKVKEDKE